MPPSLDSLTLVLLETTSRRIFIGFVSPEAAGRLVPKDGMSSTDCSAVVFNLYYPVEAVRNVISRLDAAHRIGGVSISHPAIAETLAFNEMGDNNPMLRKLNRPARDSGPLYRLFYIYLAGCDYARPLEPSIAMRSDLIEVAFLYSEAGDEQLKKLYDTEIRKAAPQA